jgi:dihydroxyacetone kinase DhaKLM complex PTS-EIIA-like component DhaM
MTILEEILEMNPDVEFVKADGLDDAIIGASNEDIPRLIYSVSKIVEILSKDMSKTEALDYYLYSIQDARILDNYPIFCWDIF